ncbi:MAG TPA: hypothetical protein VND87_18285 [Stellaceae bacterium]|nr:hypothetical protein [Stellaceae bacterium]
MLRRAALGAGIALLAAAAVALAVGLPWTIVTWLAVLGLAATLGILCERRGDKPITDGRQGPDWIDTGERFIDPETGKMVSVYHHPRTGQRRYVGR